jgi:hypothetical protein
MGSWMFLARSSVFKVFVKTEKGRAISNFGKLPAREGS